MIFTDPIVSVDKGDSFHFIKSFWAKSTDTSFSLRYTLVNATPRPIKKALGELTRVPAGGLTFWPTGPAGTWGELASATEEIIDHTWYLREEEDGSRLKFFADGKDGWFAHVADQNRIFIKTFADVARKNFAEGEGEIELWVADEYIEQENQSACSPIGVSDSLTYEVRWYLRQLPDSIQVSSGNQDLVDYVLLLITEKEIPPTSIYPKKLEPKFKIYANYAEGILYVIPEEINQEEVSYSIFNLHGQIVLEGNLLDESINISGLKEGMYLIRLLSEKLSLSSLINLF